MPSLLSHRICWKLLIGDGVINIKSNLDYRTKEEGLWYVTNDIERDNQSMHYSIYIEPWREELTYLEIESKKPKTHPGLTNVIKGRWGDWVPQIDIS